MARREDEEGREQRDRGDREEIAGLCMGWSTVSARPSGHPLDRTPVGTIVSVVIRVQSSAAIVMPWCMHTRMTVWQSVVGLVVGGDVPRSEASVG